MIGGSKSPFRTPCGGTGKMFLGFPNHRHAAEVDAYGNTTTMVDHCGATIVPVSLLPIPAQDVCGNSICSTDCNDCPPVGSGFNTVGNTPQPPSIASNTFSHTGTVQLEPVEKAGFKLAQAAKVHHGRYGFLDTCAGTTSNTKYRTVTCESTLKLYDNGPGLDDNYTEHTFNIVVTVSTIGVLSVISCFAICQYVDVVNSINTPQPGPNITLILSMEGGCLTGTIAGVMADIAAGNPDYASGGSSITDTTFTVDWVPAVHGDDSEFHGSLALSDPYTIDDVLATAVTQADNWPLTDDLQYPFRTDNEVTIGPFVLCDEKQVAQAPSIDVACLVDDWRSPTTNTTGDAPFSPGWVSNPAWTQMTWFDPDGFVFTFASGQNQLTAAATGLAAIFSGATIGAPFPAGYGQPVGGNPRGVFDRDHENWFRRNCIFGAGWTTGGESAGAFTPSYVPANAGKWTDDFTATTLYPCAFIHADTNGVYLQKGCQIPVKRPSINFARPFGPDKFLLDETAVYFVSNISGSVITLQNNTDFSTPTSLPFTTSDICGSAAVGGFFHVTAVGTNTVTLGSKVIDVPSGWDTPSRDGAACFGKLLYPNAPGMDFTDTTAETGGRVLVTVAPNSPPTTSTITTSTTQKWLSITTAETVVICDKDMNVLATVAATRVDDTHFTIPVDLTGSAPAKWMVPNVLNDGSTPGTKYKFADNRSKGDYVYRTWTVSLADGSVLASTQSDECLPFNACAPSVAGITPNGESIGGVPFFTFPTTINVGEVWLARLDFWMQDPFWQTPHVPVSATVGADTFVPGTDLMRWSMDDGSCAADTVVVGGGGENDFHLFYAMRPFVEARITIPTIDGDTPPTIASGVDITTPVGPPIQAGIGDAEGPLVNAIIVPQTDLSVMLAQRACVDSAGRFSADYIANGTPP